MDSEEIGCGSIVAQLRRSKELGLGLVHFDSDIGKARPPVAYPRSSREVVPIQLLHVGASDAATFRRVSETMAFSARKERPSPRELQLEVGRAIDKLMGEETFVFRADRHHPSR